MRFDDGEEEQAGHHATCVPRHSTHCERPLLSYRETSGFPVKYADIFISIPALSADGLPANLNGHSTWRPLSRAER